MKRSEVRGQKSAVQAGRNVGELAENYRRAGFRRMAEYLNETLAGPSDKRGSAQ